LWEVCHASHQPSDASTSLHFKQYKTLKKQETQLSLTNHASLVMQSCTVHLTKKKLEEAKTATAEFDKKIAEFKSLK